MNSWSHRLYIALLIASLFHLRIQGDIRFAQHKHYNDLTNRRKTSHEHAQTVALQSDIDQHGVLEIMVKQVALFIMSQFQPFSYQKQFVQIPHR